MKWLEKVLKSASLPSRSKRIGPIGLEVRAYSLNMVQLALKKDDGLPVIHSAASVPLPCDRETLLASPKLLSNLVNKALKQNNFIGKRCVSTIPANKVSLRNMSYDRLAKQNDMQALYPRLRELLGEKLESSVIDLIPIRPHNEKQISRSALVAITTRNDVDTYLSALDRCGLDVDSIEVGPIAIRRLISGMNPADKQSKILVINVGHHKSYLTVIWGRRILLDKEVSFGLNTVVLAIAKELDVTEQAALNLLNKYGFDAQNETDSTIQIEQAEEKGMSQMLSEIVTAVFTQLAANLRDVLMYTAAETRGGGIDCIYLMGSVAHWPGVDTLLHRMLVEPIKIINPFYGFSTECEQKNFNPNSVEASTIAVATGLALKGMIDV